MTYKIFQTFYLITVSLYFNQYFKTFKIKLTGTCGLNFLVTEIFVNLSRKFKMVYLYIIYINKHAQVHQQIRRIYLIKNLTTMSIS